MAKFVKTERRGPYTILTMAREPVNSMNLDLWQQLADALKNAEQDGSRGLIITSGLEKNIFTAGNDIKELYAPMTSKERYCQFWKASNDFLANLYSSPLVTICAIRGQCPAGGCITALVCDYRVMSSDGNPSIGLNEVALGIAVPVWWTKVMIDTIGHRQTERLLMKGMLIKTDEALRIGLIDEITTNDQLLNRAEAEMKVRLAHADRGRMAVKRILRQQTADQWRAFTGGEAEAAWINLSSPQSVAALASVLQRLSKSANATNTSKL